MATVEGMVRDISERASRELRLEVYFTWADAPALPRTHGDAMRVEISGEEYRATIGLRPKNPPYFRGTLQGLRGKTRWTDVLSPLDAQPGDRLLFEIVAPRGKLTLLSVVKGTAPLSQPSTVTPRPPASASTNAAPVTSRKLDELSRTEVLVWAERYWELISERDRVAEHELEKRMPDARSLKALEKDDFVLLGTWKSNRQRKNLNTNTGDAIARATARAFVAPSRGAITILKALKGVQLRMAVAMLHWMRPDDFPMLDFRVIESLGWEEPSNYEDLDSYEQFAAHVTLHAKRLGVDLRTLDRALWAMDKDRP